MLPQVLFIVDVPHWAIDLKTRNLTRILGTNYDIRKLYQSEVGEEDLDRADLILVYYWLQFECMQHLAAAFERNRKKLLLGVCSEFELEGDRAEPGLSTLRRWDRPLFANNRQLYLKCKSLFDKHVFYTPNGVDTGFYQPRCDKKGEQTLMRVGWAGSLTNQGPDQRGYHDFIVPAIASVAGVELVTAAREDQWRGPQEMREFYQSLDVYLCASRSEGSPNPCLEAAACGVPLLTTRVGTMPELVLHGENGFFIERDLEDITEKVRLLRDNPDLRTSMAQRITRDIQNWDWSIRSDAYRKMFEATLFQSANKPVSAYEALTALDESPTGGSIRVQASEGVSLEQVKKSLMNTATRNLRLIPDGFFAEHRDIELTIVMLSYGRLEKTLNAIRALHEHVRIAFKLLLIDNGSGEDVQTRLAEACSRYAFIELILLDENLGCVGGRDHALRHIDTEYVMFLDNDVEVFPGTVEHLLLSLEQNSDLLGAGGNFVLPNGLVHLCGADYWDENGILRYELSGAGKRFDDPIIGSSGICGWISGASLFRRSALTSNPLDLSMKAYYEDLEWCYRVSQETPGRFYRCVEALALHYHEPMRTDDSISQNERWRRSLKYIEAIARFYKIHGKIIQNIFDFVPELGSPVNQPSVSATKLLLELLNANGADWVLEGLERDQLSPLFASGKLSERMARQERDVTARLSAASQSIEDLSSQLIAKQTSFDSLSSELSDNRRNMQLLTQSLSERESELKRMRDSFGGRLLGLYGRIKYPYLLPIYRLLGLLPRERQSGSKSKES